MKLNSFFLKNTIEAGCDEAGRGCLAGPVVAAAVILKEDFNWEGLNDSKKLNKNQRNALRVLIETNAIAFAVQFIDERKIEEINILNASILAMQMAIKKLKTVPKHIIIDGNRFHPMEGIEHTCIIKGDSKYLSIAAASILAKTYRDEYMEKLSADFPLYLWHKNMGYPTKAHRSAIREIGSCEHHRTTFNLLGSQQLDLFE